MVRRDPGGSPAGLGGIGPAARKSAGTLWPRLSPRRPSRSIRLSAAAPGRRRQPPPLQLDLGRRENTGEDRRSSSSALAKMTLLQKNSSPASVKRMQKRHSMTAHSRHFTPDYRAWDSAEAQSAVMEIAADALDRLHPEALWPSHPADDGIPDGHGSVYFGAAGVLWALDRLSRLGAIADTGDLARPLEVARHRAIRRRPTQRRRPSCRDVARARRVDGIAGRIGSRRGLCQPAA